MTDPLTVSHGSTVSHEPHASTAAGSHGTPLAACPNCQAPLAGFVPPARYCPRCGQETTLHPPSVTEFAHEFVGHYVALEGPLWRTLALLVGRPGALTAAYLAGRRRHYVLPLRLYLSASFVFFLVLKFAGAMGADTPSHVAADAGVDAGAAPAASGAASASAHERFLVVTPHGTQLGDGSDAARLAREHAAACARPGAPACGWLDRQMTAASLRWMADPAAAQAAFVGHALAVAPYAMFLLLPVFAGAVALACRNRRRGFGEHVVFAMHVQAFAFLLGAFVALLPVDLGEAAFVVALAYGALALRRVYGGRWGPTLLRGGVILLGYGVPLALASAVIGAWFFLH